MKERKKKEEDEKQELEFAEGFRRINKILQKKIGIYSSGMTLTYIIILVLLWLKNPLVQNLIFHQSYDWAIFQLY